MMSRLSVCKKFDRHRSAETCRALASPDRGLGCRQDSIGHVGQRGAFEVGTHPQAFFSSLFLETVPSSSTRSAAQQGPGRCGALFPLSFLPLHHNQPLQCQAAVKSCPLSRSERVMSVPGPGRLGPLFLVAHNSSRSLPSSPPLSSSPSLVTTSATIPLSLLPLPARLLSPSARPLPALSSSGPLSKLQRRPRAPRPSCFPPGRCPCPHPQPTKVRSWCQLGNQAACRDLSLIIWAQKQ